ncbi:hypothetical protein C8046_05995 [Serinibacter arcticus]|uniref:Uncharacterized protein n=1 Tax=Serinibacter arcticus TaxID=1655435 RepID=A0A2U1ZTJ2_9MICO|nr:hypothetical protein [Serinibacter arcticus]PWD50281.1 hypothetical protein C8046_05995 [Serinibacter arcticus]
MRPGARLALEALAVAIAIVVCVAAARLAPVDTALVALLVAGALALVRVLPDGRSPRLPREVAPGRAGRRADVYRLSWGVSPADDLVSAQVLHRLERVVADRLDQPPPPGADATLARLREMSDGPLTAGRLTPADLRSTLTALEELDRLHQQTRGPR